MLRVRVDVIHDLVEDQLISWLTKYGKRCLVVKHTPVTDNEHYHAWIDSEYKEVTLRMSFKQYIAEARGNKDYALQKCDPERYEEYLTYMFNRKNGNKADYVCDREVDWNKYMEKSNQLTDEYFEKKGIKTKNDIITFLLATDKEYGSPVEIFDKVMEVSKANGIVLSINAIREIIVYVGYNGGDRRCKSTVVESVLKIFS